MVWYDDAHESRLHKVERKQQKALIMCEKSEWYKKRPKEKMANYK